jgi:hypothetical protein
VTLSALPTAGCFLVASSSQANWQAVCRSSAAVHNQVDTGIASSTVTTGTGGFLKMRVEADKDTARFYIQNGQASNLRKVATLSYPSDVLSETLLTPGIIAGRTLNTSAHAFDFFRLRVWWHNDFLPNF